MDNHNTGSIRHTPSLIDIAQRLEANGEQIGQVISLHEVIRRELGLPNRPEGEGGTKPHPVPSGGLNVLLHYADQQGATLARLRDTVEELMPLLVFSKRGMDSKGEGMR